MLEFEGVNFLVKFRRVKRPRIEFKPSGPVMIVPLNINPQDVFDKNKESILKKYRRMRDKVEESKNLLLVQRSEKNFTTFVYENIVRYSRQLKIGIKEVKFRKMKRRWGSCSSNGVITLNRCLKLLPETLIAYVTFHELVHLLIKGHDRSFKAIIANQFKDYKILERELNLYGIRLL